MRRRRSGRATPDHGLFDLLISTSSSFRLVFNPVFESPRMTSPRTIPLVGVLGISFGGLVALAVGVTLAFSLTSARGRPAAHDGDGRLGDARRFRARGRADLARESPEDGVVRFHYSRLQTGLTTSVVELTEK
jgi:hypothetical protein